MLFTAVDKSYPPETHSNHTQPAITVEKNSKKRIPCASASPKDIFIGTVLPHFQKRSK